MSATVWMALAVGAMAGLFAGCVLVVVVGIRWLEIVVARRRLRRLA